MTSQDIISEVNDKYSEWLEMAGDNSPALLTDILASMLLKERENNELLSKMIKNYQRGESHDSRTYTTKS